MIINIFAILLFVNNMPSSMKDKRQADRFLGRNLKKQDDLEDLDTDGRMMMVKMIK
jgi:hypothetical protein